MKDNAVGSMDFVFEDEIGKTGIHTILDHTAKWTRPIERVKAGFGEFLDCIIICIKRNSFFFQSLCHLMQQ